MGLLGPTKTVAEDAGTHSVILAETSRPSLASTQARIQWVPGILPWGSLLRYHKKKSVFTEIHHMFRPIRPSSGEGVYFSKRF
jgi:hypothetical protein